MTDLLDIIATNGVLQGLPLLVLALLRPFGLMFGFLPFYWAFGPDAMIRTSIALTIGIPTLAASTAEINQLVVDGGFANMALIASKEVAIGLLLGFFLSLPFWALRYAGAMIATYKGEADGGFETPQDGTITSIERLFEVIAIAAFVYAGGFWLTISTLYSTYDIWPLNRAVPSIDPMATTALMDALSMTLTIMVQTALPLLIVLFLVEFVLSIGARMAKRYQLGDMIFLLKNLITLLLLPVVVYMLWMIHTDIDMAAMAGLDILRGVLE